MRTVGHEAKNDDGENGLEAAHGVHGVNFGHFGVVLAADIVCCLLTRFEEQKVELNLNIESMEQRPRVGDQSERKKKQGIKSASVHLYHSLVLKLPISRPAPAMQSSGTREPSSEL